MAVVVGGATRIVTLVDTIAQSQLRQRRSGDNECNWLAEEH